MFFKKKVKEEKKSKNKIVYKKQTFEVGKAIVEITFDDKTKLTKFISGNVYQYVGHKDNEPEVNPAATTLALDKAKWFLLSLNPIGYGAIVGPNNIVHITDDDDNLTRVKIGVVTDAKITEVKDFSVEFNVASIVPNT